MAKKSVTQRKPAIHQGTYLNSFIQMREFLMVKVGAAIYERGWTQREAAEFLGVSQPRISDVIRGKAGKFTIDTLVLWLLSLGKEVNVTVGGDRQGEVCSARGINESIEFFTRAIALDPNNVGAFMNRGDAFVEQKQFDLAIGDYTRAIELEPSRPGPRNQRALAYRFSGQLKAALQEADAMIELWPQYAGGYAQRAATYLVLENYEQALADFTTGIALEPDRPGAYWNRAAIHQHLGDFKKAIADYDKVIKLHPQPDFARQARAALMERLSG